MHVRTLLGVIALVLVAAPSAGCRGGVSKKPPVHLVPDMDVQPKYRAQGPSATLPHGMAMQLAPAGTVARGTLPDVLLESFQHTDGSFVTESPIKPTQAVFERGREKFNVHCAPCHDRTGAGQGLVAKRWPLPIPSFYAPERADMPLGRVVKAISTGFNTMPSYAHQVTWEDRWAIALYVHALQYRMKAPKN